MRLVEYFVTVVHRPPARFCRYTVRGATADTVIVSFCVRPKVCVRFVAQPATFVAVRATRRLRRRRSDERDGKSRRERDDEGPATERRTHAPASAGTLADFDLSARDVGYSGPLLGQAG